MKAQKVFLLATVFLFCYSGIADGEEINEKHLLRDSYFGNFTDAAIVKKSGEDVFQVWEPYIEYTRTLPSFLLLEGSQILNVAYDEIWILEREKVDLSKLYWKNNKIQAATVAKYFWNNPMSRKSLPTPSYKIINIYNREFILRKLQEGR